MVSRPSLSKPNLLFSLRCFQLCFALGFLIVICYSGVHRAWWNNVTGAIAVGVLSSIATFAIIAHAIFTQIRNNPFSSRGSVYQIARLVIEVITFLLWVATVVLMLRHKGGCDNRHSIDGQDRCYDDGGNGSKVYSDQPTTQWFVGVAFDLVEW
jgi:zinc transporter ZupT